MLQLFSQCRIWVHLIRIRSSVPTHSFGSCFDMAFLARRCEARMGLVLAVHVKGFGVWLRCSIHSSIAASSSATLWKMPRRMRWRVISAKSRSTRLTHELDVGVKCSLKRLCRASQRFTFSVLCDCSEDRQAREDCAH